MEFGGVKCKRDQLYEERTHKGSQQNAEINLNKNIKCNYSEGTKIY